MNSKSITPVSTTHREDYCPQAFWIDSVDLTFDLDAAKTRVLNKMRVRRNPAVAAQALRLDGDGLTLARVLEPFAACFEEQRNSLAKRQFPT